MPKKQSPKKSTKPKSPPPSAQKKSPDPKRTDDALKNAAALAAAISAPQPTPKTTSPEPKLTPKPQPTTQRGLPAEAALSFLRDTKGTVSWSLRDLTETLNISKEEAQRVVAFLEMQGYIQQESHKSGEWLTTPSGETVSGAKPPRYDRNSVEGALTSLKQRIADTNKDSDAKFRVMRAVAFGDFLVKDRARVQAADVGVELARKDRGRQADEIAVAHSAVEAREEQSFLRELRGRSSLVNLKTYADWMGRRTHQKLL